MPPLLIILQKYVRADPGKIIQSYHIDSEYIYKRVMQQMVSMVVHAPITADFHFFTGFCGCSVVYQHYRQKNDLAITKNELSKREMDGEVQQSTITTIIHDLVRGVVIEHYDGFEGPEGGFCVMQ